MHFKTKGKCSKKVRLREGSFPKGGTIYLKTCTRQVVSILHPALMCGGAFWLFKHNQRLPLFGGFCRAALAESYGNIDLRIAAQNGERYGVADFELADSDVKSVGA